MGLNVTYFQPPIYTRASHILKVIPIIQEKNDNDILTQSPKLQFILEALSVHISITAAVMAIRIAERLQENANVERVLARHQRRQWPVMATNGRQLGSTRP